MWRGGWGGGEEGGGERRQDWTLFGPVNWEQQQQQQQSVSPLGVSLCQIPVFFCCVLFPAFRHERGSRRSVSCSPAVRRLSGHFPPVLSSTFLSFSFFSFFLFFKPASLQKINEQTEDEKCVS